VLTLAIFYYSILLERVNQKSDRVTKDIFKKLIEVLARRSPQSAISMKIEPKD
jgi:hypothetical protein